MKKLLVLPLLLGFTSTVNAETWYLLGGNNLQGTFTVPMMNKSDCDFWATEFVNLKKSDHWKGWRSSAPSAICVLGK